MQGNKFNYYPNLFSNVFYSTCGIWRLVASYLQLSILYHELLNPGNYGN